jgi:hypothetical protein
MKNFKINEFLKNVSGVYFVKYFYVNKCGKQAILALFSYIPGGWKGLFDFFDSLPYHPPPTGHSPCQ